jgi:hypothetical protein
MLHLFTFTPIFKERVWGGRKLAELYGQTMPSIVRVTRLFSPHPDPLPWGAGTAGASAVIFQRASAGVRAHFGGSLSLRERAGVRGNTTPAVP